MVVMPWVRKLKRLFSGLADFPSLCCLTVTSNRNINNKMEISTTKNVNVALLGLAFMLMFTAFQTMGNIETTILNSAKHNGSAGYVDGFHGSGYASLATIYTVFALSNWLAPPVVALAGVRLTMLLGATFYAIFIAQFLRPNDYLLYGSSALLGFGAAILWTAQGSFLTANSEQKTMSRNSGVFWAMMQTSMLIGNTFVFFQFQGLDEIGTATRTTVTTVLLVVCCMGVAVLLLLRPTPWVLSDAARLGQQADTPVQACRRAWRLLWTPNMLMLCLTFFYTGLELTFWSGVYGPSIGFTQDFGSAAKSLVGMHGMVLGAGEIIGGLLFGIFGHTMSHRGRDPIVNLGFVVHILSFFLIFINIPNEAPFGNTTEHAYIHSNEYLAIFCSLLLGFGDACFNTQVYSILGGLYTDHATSAFAIFKFVQSSAAALGFFYSDHCPLYYQLLILSVFCALGTLAFTRVELQAASSPPRSVVAEVVERDERSSSPRSNESQPLI